MIEDMKYALRDEMRIKHGVDYAVVHKFGVTRILCHETWEEDVRKYAELHKVKIDEMFLYE
jgi:hypothetical protein